MSWIQLTAMGGFGAAGALVDSGLGGASKFEMVMAMLQGFGIGVLGFALMSVIACMSASVRAMAALFESISSLAGGIVAARGSYEEGNHEQAAFRMVMGIFGCVMGARDFRNALRDCNVSVVVDETPNGGGGSGCVGEETSHGKSSEGGTNTVNPNALKYNGDGTWTSNEGLIYGQGSIHGNRVKHVIAHTQPDPSKPTHTMYNVDKTQVIGLIDEAWANKGQGIMQRNGNVKYEIDMGRVVGTNGETSIRIITDGCSNNIVTAFPVQ